MEPVIDKLLISIEFPLTDFTILMDRPLQSNIHYYFDESTSPRMIFSKPQDTQGKLFGFRTYRLSSLENPTWLYYQYSKNNLNYPIFEILIGSSID